MGTVIIWLSTKYIVDKRLFGFSKNLTTQAVTLGQFLLFGLNNALTLFIHRYNDDDKKRKLLLTLCFATPLVMVALFSAVYFGLRTWLLHHYQPEDVPLVDAYFAWLPIYTLFFVYMVLFEQYLGSQMKVAISSFMREIVVRLISIVVIVLYAVGTISFHTLVVATVLTYTLPLLIFYYLSLKTEKFGFSVQWHDMDSGEYREIVHFAWYHFLLTVSVILVGSMDVLLLPYYDHRGYSSVAVYSVAVFLISFLQMPSKALTPGSYTVMAKAFAEDDLPKARDLFERSSVNILIPTVLMAVIICANLNNAVAIINNGYADIVPLFQILLVGRVFDIATGMNDQVLSITNYYKFNFYLSLVLIVVLYGLIRFLVPHYGVVGAAWSTTSAYVVFNSVKYVFVWKKLDIQPFSKDTVVILASGAAAYAVAMMPPYCRNALVDTAVRSIAGLAVYAALLLRFKPSKDLVEYLATIKKNKRLF